MGRDVMESVKAVILFKNKETRKAESSKKYTDDLSVFVP